MKKGLVKKDFQNVWTAMRRIKQ